MADDQHVEYLMQAPSNPRPSEWFPTKFTIERPPVCMQSHMPSEVVSPGIGTMALITLMPATTRNRFSTGVAHFVELFPRDNCISLQRWLQLFRAWRGESSELIDSPTIPGLYTSGNLANHSDIQGPLGDSTKQGMESQPDTVVYFVTPDKFNLRVYLWSFLRQQLCITVQRPPN